MSTLLYDAHAHLTDTHPDSEHNPNPVVPGAYTLQRVVINSTAPEDWPAVIQSAQTNSHVIPAIGLHPWEVQQAPENWKTTFQTALKEAEAIGEIGLDRKERSHEMEQQVEAFCWQLKNAYVNNLPVSIHCVKAIGLLMETLRTQNLPARGIHLHAFSGPVELVPELSERGAYFSFSTRQLQAEGRKTIACAKAIPAERLLVETDMPLVVSSEYSVKSHCTLLHSNYTTCARIRNVRLDTFVAQTAKNFTTYYMV